MSVGQMKWNAEYLFRCQLRQLKKFLDNWKTFSSEQMDCEMKRSEEAITDPNTPRLALHYMYVCKYVLYVYQLSHKYNA